MRYYRFDYMTYVLTRQILIRFINRTYKSCILYRIRQRYLMNATTIVIVVQYKVRAVCNNCKRAWTTRAKNNSGAPSQCKFCGSTNVRRRSAWKA
jgi:hypothetical protein